MASFNFNKFKEFNWRKTLQELHIGETILLTWSISKKLTIITISLLVLENLAWLGSIYMLKELVDIAATPGNEQAERLLNAVILTGLISISYACIKSISSYYSEIQAAKVNHCVDQKIHAHIVQLDYSFYENPEYFDVLKRAREAAIDKPFSVVSNMFTILKNLIMVASVGYILVSIDWLLLPLLGMFVVPILISRIIFSDRAFQLYLKNTSLEREAGYLSSLLTGENVAKEIRTFTLGDFIFTKYVKIREHLISEQLHLSRKRSINELFTTGIGTAAFFGVTAYIVFGTLNGDSSVGDIAVFLVVFPQSFMIMQSLVAAIGSFYRDSRYVSLIFELFQFEPKIENNISKASLNNGELIMKNVSFRYPNTNHNILENISLRIPKGSIVAIVGTNGAGKTSIIKLLCKLYEPTDGSIYFGGNDIREYSPAQYRKQVSTVFQDFVKYNLTVRENISFGDIHKTPTEENILQAAINAGADDFIKKFPKKYDTVLGRIFNEGQEISQGQWQKIAIARALYSDSSLLIFDEATSALDAIAETALFNTFRERIGERAALVISHRISTIRQADYIYVMSDKRIVESGTHTELLQRNGTYAALYENSHDQEVLLT
ncbi:ABC transporter ATP-binding protein [Autumnicola edwardsiae]|jgi:ATP-binding cassette subfamily B protein|uniref:ABC transporter ATP-binding protein n=1 Tax=Autumnicola edwardsiae TaxID=3075594 RepID=A0ABU3CW53_9FLAO|nr:ABC transporter ATP-binding protein [Zunongwangia sp. F297]MDT0650501.1 ABC transporter ATP-binding protein [Zunongwangia sp. F297]